MIDEELEAGWQQTFNEAADDLIAVRAERDAFAAALAEQVRLREAAEVTLAESREMSCANCTTRAETAEAERDQWRAMAEKLASVLRRPPAAIYEVEGITGESWLTDEFADDRALVLTEYEELHRWKL